MKSKTKRQSTIIHLQAKDILCENESGSNCEDCEDESEFEVSVDILKKLIVIENDFDETDDNDEHEVIDVDGVMMMNIKKYD